MIPASENYPLVSIFLDSYTNNRRKRCRTIYIGFPMPAPKRSQLHNNKWSNVQYTLWYRSFRWWRCWQVSNPAKMQHSKAWPANRRAHTQTMLLPLEQQPASFALSIRDAA